MYVNTALWRRHLPLGVCALSIALHVTAAAFSAPPTSKTPSEEARIKRVETGLRVAGQQTPARILDRMEFHKVPGVSVAVIDGGKLAWARGYGLRQRGLRSGITPTTLFQAASMSKPVCAVAALRLVEQELVKLDDPVNKYLKHWRIPENDLTKDQPVTLRQLLSHSAGLTVHGFAGYSQTAPVPNLLQVLTGQHPANSPAITVDLKPGSQFRYSGGGYCVLQLLLEEVTKTPLDEFMRDRVFKEANMTRSSFCQPLPKNFAAQAAVGHDKLAQPLPGNWHTYPEQAAAGLWTTPQDLAEFLCVLSAAYRGEKNALLMQQTVKQMFAVQMVPYGLGFEVRAVGSLQIRHNGSNAGYRCLMVCFPEVGKGAVIMTNADNGGAIIEELMASIAAEYEWPPSR